MKFSSQAKGVSYQGNYIESLRKELVEQVETKLSPLALKYEYSKTPLEDKIKWRPVVLILGNYSSGKSTLINELLGVDVQKTGQAPTDDSFTVLTYNDEVDGVEDRDGMVLLNDPSFPFNHLKVQGQKFASHFRLKEVHSDLLKSLALIDTPGMLDSVSEFDRGYDYQQVVAELASIADLILVLFDPHKAGTIRETYESLRRTLPKATYEDRVFFVLNRIDECENLNDLLRVYGTLCWNLSQMTGRKDIPHIYLTYSQVVGKQAESREFLQMLSNQRQDIASAISKAPRNRLDRLATYIETHGEQLEQFLEALIRYARLRRQHGLKSALLGFTASVLGAGVFYAAGLATGVADNLNASWLPLVALAGGAGVGLLWFVFIQGVLQRRFHRNQLQSLSNLLTPSSRDKVESWEKIQEPLRAYLQQNEGRISLAAVVRDRKQLNQVRTKASREAREALNELAKLRSTSPIGT